MSGNAGHGLWERPEADYQKKLRNLIVQHSKNSEGLIFRLG